MYFYRIDKLLLIVFCFLIPIAGFSKDFPDAGGILDFGRPESISDRLFILTNPKSGSHLLLYSIMKITGRPLRGRLPLWYFENDPPCFPPENMMNYPLDFSKPTTYWGHEYNILSLLNNNKNKLLFILRNYKENIASQLLIKHRRDKAVDLESLLNEEVLHEGHIFREYVLRLELFDKWDSNYRCLVLFEDLLYRPEVFVPQVMSFIKDNSEYVRFIESYNDFKMELGERYEKKGNRTGSGSDSYFFSRNISLQILQKIDAYVAHRYPHLWERYLSRFAD